ncbi:unnamed protein product [Caenorhabditis auriculariae]|uniref:adenylate cyclase n=1 Tax=Caenorhabditis auriculariae TaxID=2777116 RepID=A0A8S1HSG9_9PELO|nr:unnamed protein product [Caenorhabditis auriculariae]
MVVLHLWTHFVGVYLHRNTDRLGRSAFLSARNATEAEHSAEFQSNRLNRLLSSFLPLHMITQARHQITLYTPHLYTETYPQVTVAYGRLLGFESVLSQCSSIDAARVLKELEVRIDRLIAANGCVRVASEGITAICSVPGIDSQHAVKLCRFALELEALVRSFRDSTGADVTVSVGIDSGPIAAGVVGSTKWHYDVIGPTIDNAILLQSNAAGEGVYVTNEARRLIGADFEVESARVGWRLRCSLPCSEMFPINKRFSLVTVPQAINRVLQSVSTLDPAKTLGTNKKRKLEKERETLFINEAKSDGSTIISLISQRFRNENLEQEYHKEMDQWFIPALAISIFFLVVYGIYHMLVMPRLISSLVLIVIALTLMFFILLMLYIDFFHSFSQFITRTSAGHTVTILLIITVLFLCGVVNTFSCPQPNALDVCQKAHFSTFSFAMWIMTTAVFIRFSSIYLAGLLILAVSTYGAQIYFSRPGPFGAKEFVEEVDLTCYLCTLAVMVYLQVRRCEKLLRLDFLAVVKGMEESLAKDKFIMLNNQMLLNLVPIHVAPAVVAKNGDLWHHAHHSVGIAYLAVSGFDLQGEAGINGLNFVFSYFDQTVANYKGVEKVKNANRFYVVAVGLLPDAGQNVTETPWTIGELLSTLSQFLLHIVQFAADNDFHVQIGVDCGSALAVVANTEQPHYELFGETIERSRVLMQAAGHDTILVSEEIYLALRPRPLRFSLESFKVLPNLNAYELLTGARATTVEAASPEPPTMPREEQLKHTQYMIDAQMAHSRLMYDTQTSEIASSMASSFSSELRSIDGDAETDSDIEWITPETALMNETAAQRSAKRSTRNIDYDPYREPGGRGGSEHYDNATRCYSDYSEPESRAASRSSYKHRRWHRPSSKNSLRHAFGLFRKGTSADGESTGDPRERLEAAATRVDRMIQELNAYGDFADVKPLEYQPFPTAFGSVKSIHRAMSSACHTEYDNAESEAALSDAESNGNHKNSKPRDKKRQRHRRWRRDAADADSESQCSSHAGSMDLEPLRWKSTHSIGYENEYEMRSDSEGLAIDEMRALSRDIRNNFGDFQLSTFDDIDQD